jgi:hypothetical protein
LHLEEKEQIAFIESANVIKSNIERLGLWYFLTKLSVGEDSVKKDL